MGEHKRIFNIQTVTGRDWWVDRLAFRQVRLRYFAKRLADAGVDIFSLRGEAKLYEIIRGEDGSCTVKEHFDQGLRVGF